MTKDNQICKTNYEKYYESEEYYWGLQPSDLCYEIMKIIPPSKDIKVLDIGCGEGKDAVFLAKQGYDVYAFDITKNGIRKTKALAEKEQVKVTSWIDDINDFQTDQKFDIIYSTGTIQYLDENHKVSFFEKVKAMTKENGIHWFNVFVEKPFMELPPDWDVYEKMWKTAELFSYYHDWELLRIDEKIFECHSSNVAHFHCMDTIVAKKPIQK